MTNEQFEKVVLMLSSDQPGEVVAAAAAIGRALPAAGLDWHSFAKLVAGRVNRTPPKEEGFRPTPQWAYQPTKPPPPPPEKVNEFEFNAIMQLYESTHHRLEKKERGLIETLYERCAQYGMDAYISPRQRDWLSDIIAKVLQS